MGVPGLRTLPIKAASLLARLGTENKLYVIGWVAGIFLILPMLLIGATMLS